MFHLMVIILLLFLIIWLFNLPSPFDDEPEKKKGGRTFRSDLQKMWKVICRMYRKIAYRKYNGFMLLHSKEYDGYLIYDVDNDYTDIFYYDDIERAIVELNEKRNKYIKSNQKLRKLKI